MSDKKVIKVIVTVLVFALCFVAGYFIADRFFSDDKKTDTDAEQTTVDSQQGEEESGEQTEVGDEEIEIDHSLYTYLITDEKLGNGTIEVSEAEYFYYCASIYDRIVSNAVQYEYYYGEGNGVKLTGFDYKKAPHEQKYDGEVEGVKNPTYSDYIDYLARQQIIAVKSYMDYAELNGIALTEAEEKVVDNYVDQLRETIKTNYDTTVEGYLKDTFGPNMTEALFVSIAREQYLMNKIDQIKSEIYGNSYSTEDLDKIYNEKTVNYGTVSMRAYIVVADKIKVSDSETVTDDTMADAKEDAEDFASYAHNDESFKKWASDYEKQAGNETYEDIITNDSYTLIEHMTHDDMTSQLGSSDLSDWAFSKERKAGDTCIFEREGTGYIVCMITEAVHKPQTEYTYSVRHILFKFPEESTEDSDVKAELLDTEKYTATVDIDVDLASTGDPALYMKAQGVLIDYLEGDCTEESFGELAKTYSADGNAAQGGIYEDVPEGQMVAEFEGWCLDEARKPGDVGIVESTYGYHIMYAVDKEVATSWETIVRNATVYDDMMKFTEKLADLYKLDIENFSKEKLENDLADIAKSSVEYYESMMG